MRSMNDYIRLNQMALQTWTACLQTISLRTELMSTHPPLSKVIIRENLKMSTEKISATFELYAQLQASAFDLYHGKFDAVIACEEMLKPISQKATANARRLSRQVKKR